MKLRSIFLATAVLASPTYAADLGVLTSLDVCDSLGLSGLAISSDTNCLQVSGEFYYEFQWGDFKGARPALASGYSGTLDIDDKDAVPGTDKDWNSWIDTYLKVVGTAPSDFGPAKASIQLYDYRYNEIQNGLDVPDSDFGIDHAYVSIGDTTILTAGLVEDSIFNEDDDYAFGWLDSFIAYETDGVAWDGGTGNYVIGGHAIQLTSDFGNGFQGGVALEDLDGQGSLVGVLNYAGGNVTAHVSVLAGQVLDGSFDDLAVHTGVTATFDQFKVRGAFAANNSGWWNGLLSGEATIDMFTLAATVDATSEREWGLVGSGSAKLNDSFTVKVGARYVDPDTDLSDDEGTELRGRVEYAVSEALTLSAEVGQLWTGAAAPSGALSVTDGLLEAGWVPGGGFEATAGVGVNSLGAYKLTFAASKTFE